MNRTAPEQTKLVIYGRQRVAFWNPPPKIAERVRARWPGMNVLDLHEPEILEREIADADIFTGFVLRAEPLALARRLRWIHATSSSISQMLYPEMRASGMAMTNARGVQSRTIAEHVLGTMIALGRRFAECFRQQQAAHWAQRELCEPGAPPLRELGGQTLLIVGFGEIGRAVAKLVAPLGVRILGVTRSGRGSAEGVERVAAAAGLRGLLPEADFVLLAAPETAETREMIGEREIALMKRSAYLINVARGTLVNEAALIAALESRRIAGAALDVTAQEPLPAESPLWKLENVLLTPHVSAISDNLWTRQGDLLIENLERWFDGRELLNRVDLERGY